MVMKKVDRKASRIAARLKELRKASGLTQIEVARSMEWQQSRVSKIESGEVSLCVVTLISLLKVFGFKGPDAAVEAIYVLYGKDVKVITAMV